MPDGRCEPWRLRTGRRRCLRCSSPGPVRDSGPACRASRWRWRNASTPPSASSALASAPGIVAAVVDHRLAVAIRNAHRDRAFRRRAPCCGGAPRPARGASSCAIRSISPLGHLHRLGTACSAVRRVRHLVGGGDPRLDVAGGGPCRAREDAPRCCTPPPRRAGSMRRSRRRNGRARRGCGLRRRSRFPRHGPGRANGWSRASARGAVSTHLTGRPQLRARKGSSMSSG